MFDLFGAEMPLAVRFFLAFLIVLGLIGAAAWAVRRFGSTRLGGTARGRQPRLAVIDYASVDARRRLILVRRDNVEHLLMIGGPTDVVVESNIVRAIPAARDVPVARAPAVMETLPRAIALPEVGSNGSAGSWPLQPDAASAPPPRETPPPPSREAPRLQRETPAALADDLEAHPAPVPPGRGRTGSPPPRPYPDDSWPEPRMPSQPANAEVGNLADQGLAEMAQRLEAALRKTKISERPAEPRNPPAIVAAPARAAPAVAAAAEDDTETEAAPPAPAPPLAPQPRPARAAEAKPDGKSKESKLYDTLEQEMASLLGRPPGKTG